MDHGIPAIIGLCSLTGPDARDLRRQRWCLLAVLFMVGLWNLPTLWYPYGQDQALAHVIARLILDGKLPYRDALDVKPPGIFYLYALTIALGGEGMQWARMADLLGLWATVFIVWRVGKAMECPTAGLWGAFLFGLAYPLMGFWNTALQEGFLLPFLWGSLLAALLGWRGAGMRGWFLCGSCLGVVFWFKYPYVLPLGVVAIAAWMKGRRARPRGTPSLRYLVGLTAGFLLVLGLGGIYLWKMGVLEEMLEITIAQNIGERLTHYGLLTQETRSLEPWDWILETPLLVCIGVMGAMAVLSQWIRRPRGWGLILGYGVSMVAAIYLQVRFFQYHWIPLLSFLCFWSGLALSESGRIVRHLAPRATSRACLSTAGLVAVLLMAAGLVSHQRDVRVWFAWIKGKLPVEAFLSFFPGTGQSPPFVLEDWRASEFLRGLEIPDETLFVWGSRPLVYYFSGLEPTSRFLYAFHFHIRGPMGEAYRVELQEELRARPPGVILIPARERWTDTLAFIERVLPKLHALLGSHYVLSDRVRPFLVYTRIREGPDGG
jgi:hypothetical protein